MGHGSKSTVKSFMAAQLTEAGDQVEAPNSGLILNADDWGRDAATTDAIRECFEHGTLSSASGMVFMEDSERAASLALEHGLDIGLHLNLTTPFSGERAGATLKGHQARLASYLRSSRFAPAVFHPGLVNAFHYVFSAQWDEFSNLYGREPHRADGHHHMHLSANVLLQRLLPRGIVLRRNFSFQRGEKGLFNRMYRSVVDRSLARKYRLADYFFSLPPILPGRVERIAQIASKAIVEVETHPINPDERRLLTEGGLRRLIPENLAILPAYFVPLQNNVDSLE